MNTSISFEGFVMVFRFEKGTATVGSANFEGAFKIGISKIPSKKAVSINLELKPS